MHKSFCVVLGFVAVAISEIRGVDLPEVRDPDLQFLPLAEAPEIVTPIGVAVDQRGRIFVVESHTHFPKPDYPGPQSDRILVFDNSVKPKPTVFAEGLKWAMNLAFGSGGSLYVTHRNGVVRYDAAATQDRAAAPERVIQLETEATYPHNGVGGIAFGPDGLLYVGLGENLGATYVVRGRDHSAVVAPEGAGGVVVRCRPDGSQIELWATGFWNAFGLEFDARGRLYGVDNDPDSRPPCRLLHVIRGGYYGFQFRHGRNGLSPFTAWNGELPGSLPMVAGTGEAPSGVLDSARARLPEAYSDTLLVAATWANALERYRMLPMGSSFRAEREVIVQGNADFRPVALADAPDGSVVITDWVKSDYNVHRQGRLWRLSMKSVRNGRHPTWSAPNTDESRLGRMLRPNFPPPNELAVGLASADPFLFSAAVSQLARQPVATITNALRSPNPRTRVASILAARQAQGSLGLPRSGATNANLEFVTPPPFGALLESALRDPAVEVRIAALVWIGEDRRQDFAPLVAQALGDIPVTAELLAVQAETLRWLANDESTVVTPSGSTVQTFNLATMDSSRVAQAVAVLRDRTTVPTGRRGAIADLAGTHDPSAVAVLQSLVRDAEQPPDHRADALLALTGSHEDHVTALAPALIDAPAAVRIELVRALRPWRDRPGVNNTLERLADESQPWAVRERARFALGQGDPRPTDDADWRQWLSGERGDPEVGRRVFFAPETSCAKCHRVEGRGGLVGPDLSTIARGADRERLLQSLVNPSRDIAPQFAQEVIETRDGEAYSGRVFASSGDGSLTLLSGEGTAVAIPAAAIQDRRGLSNSLMPDGLLDSLTAQDFRDLMAFLESRK